MNRCSICKRFIKNINYMINKFTEEISNVKGTCSRCGVVPVEYDCYEDIVGW